MRFLRLPLLFALWLAACGGVDAFLDGGSEPDASVDAWDSGATDDAGSAEDSGTPDAGPAVPDSGCPEEMARILGYCVDRWEAHTVEVLSDGGTQPHSPFLVIAGKTVAARSAPHVYPQGYISQLDAAKACALAGKRLCTKDEFSRACRGPDAGATYPYGGTTRIPGACNEGKGSMMVVLFGSNSSLWTYAEFNDPRLNQLDGGLFPTASFPRCVSPDGVWDCVGNLHEWGADPADSLGHGRFRGGFYGDAEYNGHGCAYVTSAHELAYHDYSTGFRCCADAR